MSVKAMVMAIGSVVGAIAAVVLGWKLKSGSDAMKQVKTDKADDKRAKEADIEANEKKSGVDTSNINDALNKL